MSESQSILKAGAARVDITPELGTHLAGDASRYRGAESILDPVYARATVFEAGHKRLGFVSLDATVISREYTQSIREAVEARCRISNEALMVHTTHTHSAPSVGHYVLDRELFDRLSPEHEFLKGGDLSYADRAVRAAVKAVTQACARLRPVEVAYGYALCDDLAFNRRAVRRDGRVAMPFPFSSEQHPLGLTPYLYLEGPTDPEVGIFCTRSEERELATLLLHHTCHPVNVFAQKKSVVSADWPGAWCAGAEARFGGQCAPLVLNGCCGNINPWPAFQPDYCPDHGRMGAGLAQATHRIMETLSFSTETSLDWQSAVVSLPIREPDKDMLAKAEALLAEKPLPPPAEDDPSRIDQEWRGAAGLLSVQLQRCREGAVDYEVQAFRIGDVAFVGLGGEPFVEGQLRLKLSSPARQTLVACCCNGFVGYLPTREAFSRGGHEAGDLGWSATYWAKVGPDALDAVIDKAAALLKELF